MRPYTIPSLLIVSSLLIACGGNDATTGLVDSAVNDNGNNINLSGDSIVSEDMSLQTNIANAFCTNQRKLQLISEGMLAAFSPKGNGSDAGNCGGENNYSDDGTNFSLQLNNYCMESRGEQYLLNGSISGMTESGNNFTSTISSLSIQGGGIDLGISGETWDGRADDNFVNLTVQDHSNTAELRIEETSVKKGELDFGLFSFPGLGSVPYKFITHFNADNTEGLLFIYGNAGDKIIISGDEGMITAVYQTDKFDPGTWLDLPCNN